MPGLQCPEFPTGMRMDLRHQPQISSLVENQNLHLFARKYLNDLEKFLHYLLQVVACDNCAAWSVAQVASRVGRQRRSGSIRTQQLVLLLFQVFARGKRGFQKLKVEPTEQKPPPPTPPHHGTKGPQLAQLLRGQSNWPGPGCREEKVPGLLDRQQLLGFLAWLPDQSSYQE